MVLEIIFWKLFVFKERCVPKKPVNNGGAFLFC